MALDFSICRFKPYDIQRVGIEELFKWKDEAAGRVYGGCFALFDEMGVGKTFQVINAAQFLYLEQHIKRVLVIAPASVRNVWYDQELGELTKHLWADMPATVVWHHSRQLLWRKPGKLSPQPMTWVITNYEFIRREEHLEKLVKWCNASTLLVLDESSAVKGYNAEQTKSCIKLRKACGRVWELNGTPIAHSPADMYSQSLIMDQRILGCNSWYHFRGRYAVMGGFKQKQIVGWHDLDDLQRRLKPYVLRRLKTDSLDLPAKLPSVHITAQLTDKTWRVYKQMRDDMVAWLDQQNIAVAHQAAVKALRLCQITSGFVGGIEELPANFEVDDEGTPLDAAADVVEGTVEVGREKLDAVLELLDRHWDANANLKLLLWCRFKPELFRLLASVASEWPTLAIAGLHGGQKRADRQLALRLLDPRTAPSGPALVAGTPATGSMGLNLTAAHTVVYVSNDPSLKNRLQSEDRVHRGGQVYPCSYFDIIACGPAGQKTIDHRMALALKNKEDIAAWTVAAWRKALTEE